MIKSDDFTRGNREKPKKDAKKINFTRGNRDKSNIAIAILEI